MGRLLAPPDMNVHAARGGPGRGKPTLLERGPAKLRLRDRVTVLAESIRGMRFVRMSPRSPESQCALVGIQAGMEEGLKRALVGTGRRVIVCHRGTLDPCAFWMSFGDSWESFSEMRGSTAERLSVFGVRGKRRFSVQVCTPYHLHGVVA